MENIERDHTAFIARLTARIATFSSQMVEQLLRCDPNIEKGEPNKKIKDQAHQQDFKQISHHQQGIQEVVKRKYSKARPRLSIDFGERPKAPTSSFLLYYHDNRKKLQARFGEKNVSKLTKLAATVWNDLAQQEKMKYQKISMQSKERYQNEMKVYFAKNKEKLEEAMKKRRVQYRMNWLAKKKEMKEKKIAKADSISIEYKPSNTKSNKF